MSSKLHSHACEDCGKPFVSYNRDQRACSRKCSGRIRSRESRVERVCLTCTGKFHVTPGEAKEGRGLYCSRPCSENRDPKFDTEVAMAEWSAGKSTRQVALAVGVSEMTVARWLKKLKLFERRKASGPNAHNWKGGIRVYRRRAIAAYGPKCQKCGYDRYPQILQVHHKDGDRTNNETGNLIPVCPNCHEETHYLEGTGRFDKDKRKH